MRNTGLDEAQAVIKIARRNINNLKYVDDTMLMAEITADGGCSHEIKRCFILRRKAVTNLECIKKQRRYFANKGLYSQSYGFSSRHVWMDVTAGQ